MNSLHFCQMIDNAWAADNEAQGEYCQIPQDLVTIYEQECQELLGGFPVVREVEGAIAVVETFPGFQDIWLTTPKEPEQGIAIHLGQMNIWAIKPLEIR